MAGNRFKSALYGALMCALLPAPGWAQATNATITGSVTDPTGAVVPEAQLALTSVDRGVLAGKATSGPDGIYSFPNLIPGNYQLKVSARGFRDFVQSGILVTINEVARVDVKLQLGTAQQTVEVTAEASPLQTEGSAVQGGITPKTIQELPLIVSERPRSAAAFIILLPGVSTGGRAEPFDSRINGGMQSGDEAILDGVSLQQGTMSQSGLISIFQDFAQSPDMASEVKVLTSTYDPQYGATTSGVTVMRTRGGTDQLHGNAFWFHRNTSLNARRFGSAKRSKNLQNDVGGNIGGPAKIPLLWAGRRKTYFYVNFERFTEEGGSTSPVVSIPTAAERNGDFRDWRDAQGNLIPIFDPATTRANPNFNSSQPTGPNNLPFLRDQFMGCEPVNNPQPNVICSTDPRLQNSLSKAWFKFLPDTNLQGPLNNFLVPKPVPDILLGFTRDYLFRVDVNWRETDHFFASSFYQSAVPLFNSLLPQQLATERVTDPQFAFVNRFNWDHTFGPTLLNHFAWGYLDRNEGNGAVNAAFSDQFPQIKGTNVTNQSPAIRFSDGFQGFGSSNGSSRANRTTRPAVIVNDMMTWVRDKHSYSFGTEVRKLGQNIRNVNGQAGTFSFARGTTGLIGINSGSPVASFLLGAVGNATVNFPTVTTFYPRQSALVFFWGDTFKVTPKLTLNYGLRWDSFRPTVEKFNHFSFFDPLGPNPLAGGRPGRLAFAGTKNLLTGQDYGEAGFGRRHPENTWNKGFQPRLGIAYALNDKTVIRSGYGIFFTQAFNPGWNGGISVDGFNTNAVFSSSNGGLTPAFLLQDGLPPSPVPPFINGGADNGKNPLFRPFNSNVRPYTQQWNFTIERQVVRDMTVSVAYVGTKGTRLPSSEVPRNALDPNLLSMGQQLFDQFGPNDTVKDGVPLPYPGWVQQISSGCAPSVAQALLPFPQFCSRLLGLTENAGNSTYHSFQLKAQKRFSNGTFLLASYTLSKLLTDSEHVDQAARNDAFSSGISPFQRHRNKSLAAEDVPNTLSVSLVYDLPVGRGKRFLHQGGALDKLVGGWQASSTSRFSSGIPFFFRSSNCNVPSQFQARCIPALLPGANPFAQNPDGKIDLSKPLFNANAFENGANTFQFDFGQGPRISNIRQRGYHNVDFSLMKQTYVTEKLNFQIRAEFFNVFNWHILNARGGFQGSSAFDTDLGQGSFGKWNGSVSDPRVIQVSLRIQF